jgi:hypothetical protein
MSKKKIDGPLFVKCYFATMDSPAWRALPLGARLLYLALKRRYHRTKQEAVFLSMRDAATELGSHTKYVGRWFRALEHHGFIVQVRPGSLRKSPLYRLTDEPYRGSAPTRDFEKKKALSYKSRTTLSYKSRTAAKWANGKSPDLAEFSENPAVLQKQDVSRSSSHLAQPRGLLKARGRKPGQRVRPDVSAVSGVDQQPDAPRPKPDWGPWESTKPPEPDDAA